MVVLEQFKHYTSSSLDELIENILIYPNPTSSLLYLDNINYNNFFITVSDNLGRG